MKRGLILLLAIIATALSLPAACGGDDDAEDSAASTTPNPVAAVATPNAAGVVEVIAKDVKFVPGRIRIPAGETVELRLNNEDGQEHDLQVTGLEVEVMAGGATGEEHEMETAAPSIETPEHGGSPSGEMGPVALHTTANGEDSITFVAREPGEYEFWCTITGHKEAGMVGILTVE